MNAKKQQCSETYETPNFKHENLKDISHKNNSFKENLKGLTININDLGGKEHSGRGRKGV